MMECLTKDPVLFSNDAFGQHYATEHLFNVMVDQDERFRELFNIAKSDKNVVITEIMRSKSIVLGSPTINNGILTSMASILDAIKGLKSKGKKAAAFGAYGWSGGGVVILTAVLKDAGFEVMDDGIKALWNPDDPSKKSSFE